ncbi:hypothetical protein PV703_27705 [Streptomyces sp. ME01-24h]|nr:hypothetical protein [Streptomyces sp. ME01-24h]
MKRPGLAGREDGGFPVRVPKPLLAACLTMLAAAVSVACFAQVI